MASPPQNHFTFENYNSSCLHCTDWNNVLVSDRKIQASARQTNDSNDIKETEDLLSNELSKLSMNERSQAYDDLHCVGDELQETPEMVEKSLFEFDQAISKHRNSAYDIAWKQNKAYVEDPSFRLKFLRAQMHNVSKAVHQMMNFLRYKGEFFGEDKIARDITLADLSEEDKELMMSGILHIQAERDRMGRVVLYTLTKDCGRFKPESTVSIYIERPVWYYICCGVPCSLRFCSAC